MTRPTRFIASCALLTSLVAIANPVHAQVSPADAVADNALGVGLSSLPAGWSQAPAGQYTPGTIALITKAGGESDLRLSVQPLGTADTSDEATAATAAADQVVQRGGDAASVTRTPITVAGSKGVMLQGMPGPANVQIVLAHGGALYDVVTFDSNALQPDQDQALASMHFIARSGSLPSANPPAPQGTHETRPAPPTPSAGTNTSVAPNTISGVSMYVFWGNAVNAGCGSHGGALATTCGGYFYGQGDHTGQNYYAIDWPLYAGNSIFAQGSNGGTVTHAGWTQGQFGGYGNWVVVNYGSGVYGYYAHLQDVSVSVGQGVGARTVLGHSGCTGNCSGAHVHVAWVTNPSLDGFGQPYNGTAQPQTPLYTYSSTYPVYNSLSAGQIVNGW